MSSITRRTLPSVLAAVRNGNAPTGVIEMFGGSTAPSGYLLCDGSAVSRTTYSVLFGVVGTTYGAGDGSTTFNLPNMAAKFPRGNTPGTGAGADTHTHTSAAHTHPLSSNGAALIIATATDIGSKSVAATAWTDQRSGTLTNGTSSNSRSFATPLAGSSDSTTPGNTGSSSNVPAYTGVTFIIKT